MKIEIEDTLEKNLNGIKGKIEKLQLENNEYATSYLNDINRTLDDIKTFKTLKNKDKLFEIHSDFELNKNESENYSDLYRRIINDNSEINKLITNTNNWIESYEIFKGKKEPFIKKLNELEMHVSLSNRIEKTGMKKILTEQVNATISEADDLFKNPNKNRLDRISNNLERIKKSLDFVDKNLSDKANIVSRFFNGIKDTFTKLFGKNQLEKAKNTLESLEEIKNIRPR